MKSLPLLCWLAMFLPVISLAKPTGIIQTPSGSSTDEPTHEVDNVVDENILWALFHAHKLTQLNQQIKHLKQQFPTWQPPTDLINALRGTSRATPEYAKITDRPDERILWRLFHAGKYAQLTEQANRFKQLYPLWLPPKDLTKAMLDLKRANSTTTKNLTTGNKDPCPNLPTKWSAAEANLTNHNYKKAVDIYQKIIVQCPTANKMQTLEKAEARLAYPDFEPLLGLSRSYLPSLYLDYLKYHALKNRLLNLKPLNLEQHKTAVREINYLIDIFKDADLAAVIGWRYHDLQAFKLAQNWFEKSVSWNPRNDNAQYGQILSLQKAGENDRALAVFTALKTPSNDLKAIASKIFKAKAWQHFDHHQFSSAAENIQRAQEITGLDPEIQTLHAWIAKRERRFASAAKWFDELYQQSPTQQYAQAYIQSQVEVDRGVLAEKAAHSKGILLDEYRQYHGTELYERKQFQSAFKLSPNSFPLLQNIDSTAVDMGGYVRYKSGENGLGRLDLFKAPVATATYTFNGDHNFNLSFSRIQLFSGSPSKCQTPIGHFTTAELSTCGAITPFTPTQQLNDALEIDFSYRKSGWFSPFVKIGSTPIGGAIDPTVTYDVGFEQQARFGHWGLAVYSQPIRQSILSYTGIKDPYGQGEWGRVLRTGIKPKLYYRFNERWNSNLSVDLALLEGKNVEQNTTVSVSATLARNLSIKGFDYFNVGPAFNYEHFEQNLSHFTYGQGGYFSPEHYFNVGAGINFLTEESKPYLIKGRLVGGYQDITEASSPWLPLNPQATGTYASNYRNGAALDFELKGVWLLTPNIQLGAGTAIRKTNGYDDYTGGLFVRYFFKDRKAAFSSDIADGLFSSMY